MKNLLRKISSSVKKSIRKALKIVKKRYIKKGKLKWTTIVMDLIRLLAISYRIFSGI